MPHFDHYQPDDKIRDLPPFQPDAKAKDPALYQPPKGLPEAVNVALALGLPLLLTGEPGTGKTELAHHIARQFGLGPALVFNAQTVSERKDLFYRYDALGHLQWAQARGGEPLGACAFEDRFIRYEALGEAIRRADQDGQEKKRSVVLLDEIDKAPRDLPNDVLAAIEELAFDVPEIPVSPKKAWCADPAYRPIIVITSNSEKNLPDAFLRRVVYFHIEFPDREHLLRILAAKTAAIPETGRAAIVDHFERVRALALNKKPATAELIAWAMLLPKIGFPVQKLADTDALNSGERTLLHTSYAVLAKTREDFVTLTRKP